MEFLVFPDTDGWAYEWILQDYLKMYFGICMNYAATQFLVLSNFTEDEKEYLWLENAIFSLFSFLISLSLSEASQFTSQRGQRELVDANIWILWIIYVFPEKGEIIPDVSEEH